VLRRSLGWGCDAGKRTDRGREKFYDDHDGNVGGGLARKKVLRRGSGLKVSAITGGEKMGRKTSKKRVSAGVGGPSCGGDWVFSRIFWGGT